MPRPQPHAKMNSLWQAVSAAGRLSRRWLSDTESQVSLAALSRGSSLGPRLAELRGRSVLLSTRDQLPAALALIELDGIARRIVLCPPDVSSTHLHRVMATAGVDAVVGDRAAAELGGEMFVSCAQGIAPGAPNREPGTQTEWVLLTSGTTGAPKLVRHTLATLTGAMASAALGYGAVWSTFYDMRRYGGLQIFLRAMLGGSSMVLSSALEPVGAFLARAGALGVTHISGTPSHWRRALMSTAASKIAPKYVRLSGEIADQAILDHLRARFPKADVAHAFASTEAGVAFDVRDGLSGFPASYVRQSGDVEMRVVDGALRIRSARIALGYLGDGAPALVNEDGFVDTGDIVELRDGRYHFVGRRGGVINVGGQKVHPEEIEAVINRHPEVQMSRVRARKNPITGAIVVADVVPMAEHPPLDALKVEILDACRDTLARHKVPASIHFVTAIEVAASGKLARANV